MRRNKQESPAEFGQRDAGDMWLALARLHASHRDPVGRLVPFERPEALLSLTKPDELLFTARVELSGMETMGHLHDLIRTVTHGVTTELGYAGPGVALEVMVGKRHELALHPAHVDGLTRLLRGAVGTIAARNARGRPVLPLRRHRACPPAVGAGRRASLSGWASPRRLGASPRGSWASLSAREACPGGRRPCYPMAAATVSRTARCCGSMGTSASRNERSVVPSAHSRHSPITGIGPAPMRVCEDELS